MANKYTDDKEEKKEDIWRWVPGRSW